MDDDRFNRDRLTEKSHYHKARLLCRENVYDNCDKLIGQLVRSRSLVRDPPALHRDPLKKKMYRWRNRRFSRIRRLNAEDFGGNRRALRDQRARMRSLLNPRTIGVILLRRTYKAASHGRGCLGGKMTAVPCSRIALIWGNAHRKTRKKHYVTFKRVCIRDSDRRLAGIFINERSRGFRHEETAGRFPNEFRPKFTGAINSRSLSGMTGIRDWRKEE